MIKLNTLFANERNRSLIDNAILHSRYSGQEVGYDLCEDKNGNISLENKCFGDECSVRFEDRCPRNKMLVGNFHTHPLDAETTPSMDDLLTAYARGVGCIGRSKTLDVMCINRKEEYNTTDFTTLLSVKNSIYTKEDIERLKNKFFDTTIFR